MRKNKLPGAPFDVSVVGMGGHYMAMEEGEFEERFAYVDKEVAHRTALVERAFASGINYFDSTWRNEAVILGKALKNLGIRDKVFVNGMVLGAFRGSKARGVTASQYFDMWLDQRLAQMPGNRFDSVMINAIEEDYNERQCEELVRLLERRQRNGDFSIFGFSCHDHRLARKVAETFSEFRIIMTAYNYHNRAFEAAFSGYRGNAVFIAMKPLVWMEYGIAFCALNSLQRFEELFGFPPDPQASAKALGFIASNPMITTVVCAMNSLEEVDAAALAGQREYSPADEAVLAQYENLQTLDESIPLYLSATEFPNFRMNYFAVLNLARKLGVDLPPFPLNEDQSEHVLAGHLAALKTAAGEMGYGKYL